jgi:hypothetical protein
LWIEQLVFKAETLDFVEIQGNFFRTNLVNSDACYWFIRPIVDFVKCKGSLASINYKLCCFWLKLPWYFVFSMTHKLNFVLTKDINFIISKSIVLGMLRHCKSKCLTDHIIKWHSEKVASNQQQTYTIYSIKFTPFCFFFKNFIYLHGLASLSYAKWYFFFLLLFL